MIDRFKSGKFVMLLAAAASTLGACKEQGGEAVSTATAVPTKGRLVLQVTGAETVANGSSCVLAVKGRNDTGAAALNVQAAWMAQTEGFGIISDYQMLGDFAAGEARDLRLGVSGSPCAAVRSLELTRAVCTVGPEQDPPRSCADLVLLDGAGVVGKR